MSMFRLDTRNTENTESRGCVSTESYRMIKFNPGLEVVSVLIIVPALRGHWNITTNINSFTRAAAPHTQSMQSA